MIRKVLLISTALIGVQQAHAQSAPASTDAQIEALRAQVEALQVQINELRAQTQRAATTANPATAPQAAQPSWKGAPQFSDDTGFSFKIRGRMNIDAAYAGRPPGYTANRNLGFNARFRRFRIGVDGSIPGGFSYKGEADFANAGVSFGDVILTYGPADQPFALTIGNQESLNGMEQQTSDNWVSFLERPAKEDAFLNTRRIGLVAGLHSKDQRLRFDAGLFAAHSIDGSFDNDGWIAGSRVTWTPVVGNGFVHLGANFQHRAFASNNGGTASVSNGASSTNQIARYRARPFLQSTDVRLVDSGPFAARGDDIWGVELWGVFKSLHIGGEGQWLKVRGYRPGSISTGLDAFAGGSVVTSASNPRYFGGFLEAGYFFTGETRGYKQGLWDRTKVRHPFSKGGWGALQLVARLDYLDLDSRTLTAAPTTNFANGNTSLAATGVREARGGTQTGYLLGLNWMPSDYLRLFFDFAHLSIDGGPFAAAADPLSSDPVYQRSYSTDSFAVRAQLDF